jgi:APA family basic amino acid/polyamine antiporter
LSLSSAQLLGIAVIALLTFSNTLGLRYGKLVQRVFTVAKTRNRQTSAAAGEGIRLRKIGS